jgi:phosphate starvation-inducible PhoH-like protein
VVTGDPSQIDLRRHVKSGLREAVELLQDVEGVRFVNFAPKDIVRLQVVQRIIEAYQTGRTRKTEPQRLKEPEAEGKDSCPTPDV